MKNIKIILSVLCLMAFANVNYAQSAKLKQKAADKVEKLNAKIVSIDADLALSDEQVTQITELEVKRLMAVRKIKKSDASPEEIKAQKKAKNKEFNKMINKDILTKEQRKAKKAAKEAAKDKS